MSPEAVLNSLGRWNWSEDDCINFARLLLDEVAKRRKMVADRTCLICSGDRTLPNGKRCTAC